MEITLQHACEELKLQIITPFKIISNGKELCALALVEELGAPKGMIVVDKFEKLDGLVDELLANGYGFSTLSPRYSLDYYIEMFRDWGWSREDKAPPDWIK